MAWGQKAREGESSERFKWEREETEESILEKSSMPGQREKASGREPGYSTPDPWSWSTASDIEVEIYWTTQNRFNNTFDYAMMVKRLE